MIEEIKSKDNPLIKYIYKLKSNPFSKEEKKFVIESEHLCEMAGEYLLFVLTEKRLDEKKFPNQYIVSKQILEKLSEGKSSARIIGVCSYLKESDFLSKNILFLDDVQDPGNVGTIFRTALGFDFLTVISSSKTASKYNFKVIQSSQGAIFKLNLKNGTIDTLKELKKNGYTLIGTALNKKTISLKDFRFNKKDKYAIILGNEGQGISKDILDCCDITLKIDIKNIESLNVAIAGAIIMNKACNEGE